MKKTADHEDKTRVDGSMMTTGRKTARNKIKIVKIEHKPHIVVNIDPGDPSNMLYLYALDLTHASVHSVWLNDLAP